MKAKKKQSKSDLLRESLRKTQVSKVAFSQPLSREDERLNPAPKAPEGFAGKTIEKLRQEESPQPESPIVEGKKKRKDTRLKTKGILFRMEPRLYEALVRCSATDDELKTITDIITRGAVNEVARIVKKYNGILKTPPPERMDKSRELLDQTLGGLNL